MMVFWVSPYRQPRVIFKENMYDSAPWTASSWKGLLRFGFQGFIHGKLKFCTERSDLFKFIYFSKYIHEWISSTNTLISSPLYTGTMLATGDIIMNRREYVSQGSYIPRKGEQMTSRNLVYIMLMTRQRGSVGSGNNCRACSLALAPCTNAPTTCILCLLLLHFCLELPALPP